MALKTKLYPKKQVTYNTWQLPAWYISTNNPSLVRTVLVTNGYVASAALANAMTPKQLAQALMNIYTSKGVTAYQGVLNQLSIDPNAKNITTHVPTMSKVATDIAGLKASLNKCANVTAGSPINIAGSYSYNGSGAINGKITEGCSCGIGENATAGETGTFVADNGAITTVTCSLIKAV